MNHKHAQILYALAMLMDGEVPEVTFKGDCVYFPWIGHKVEVRSDGLGYSPCVSFAEGSSPTSSDFKALALLRTSLWQVIKAEFPGNA